MGSAMYLRLKGSMRPTCIDFRHGGGDLRLSLAMDEVLESTHDLGNVCAKTCRFDPVGLSEYAKVLAYIEVVTNSTLLFDFTVALAHLPASFESFAGILKGYK